MSARDLTPAESIRIAARWLIVKHELGQLDRAALATGVESILADCEAIDGQPRVDATVRLPVLTLADVARQARPRPALSVVPGGRT